MNHYQTWAEAELRWTEDLRRRKRKQLGKAALLTLLPFLGGAVLTPLIMALQGFLSDPAEGLAYGLLFLFFGLFLILLFYLIIFPQTTRRSYVKRLRRMAKRLSPEDREDLGRDLLEALSDPRRHFEFADSVQAGTPFHFLLGRRWAFLSGGQRYEPAALPLAGVHGFSTGQDALAVGGKVVRFFYIYFDGLPDRDRMGFHDEANRDRVLSMLRAWQAEIL